MKPKRTPAPWTVRYDGTAVVYGQQQIAIVPNRGESYDAEQRANAALIAAAPEMLEELKTLIACHRKGTETPEDLEVILEHAERVIAKAEGQS